MSARTSIEWADAEIAKHEAAIADLQAYKRVELRKLADISGPKAAVQTPATVTRPKASTLELLLDGQRVRGAKKRQMLNSIAKTWGGLSTAGVIENGRASGFPDMRVENVSPQLSACRKDGLLTLNDGKWTITEAGRKYLEEESNNSTPETRFTASKGG